MFIYGSSRWIDEEKIELSKSSTIFLSLIFLSCSSRIIRKRAAWRSAAREMGYSGFTERGEARCLQGKIPKWAVDIWGPD